MPAAPNERRYFFRRLASAAGAGSSIETVLPVAAAWKRAKPARVEVLTLEYTPECRILDLDWMRLRLMKSMKIGEVAKLSGVGIETIRFYEREGLLQEPQRRPSGYRQYDESTIGRLEYICRAKELGFTLAEIRELLELSLAAHGDCVHIRQRAEAKITDIESKIRSLQKMKRSLRRIVQHCKTDDSPRDCPLVHGDREAEIASGE